MKKMNSTPAKTSTIGKEALLSDTVSSQAAPSAALLYFFLGTPREVAAQSCVLPLLLLLTAPLYGVTDPLHIQGRMSKLRHILAWQRMAKFASRCYDLISKEKGEQTGLYVVIYVILIRHGQVTTYRYVFS